MFYTRKTFDLKARGSGGKDFIWELYNLADSMRTNDAILTDLKDEPEEFTQLLARRFKETFHGSSSKPSNMDNAGGQDSEGNAGGNNEGGNTGAQRADRMLESTLKRGHYALLPDRICDPMFKVRPPRMGVGNTVVTLAAQLPSHVHRICHARDKERRAFIAKKQVRKSKELEILRMLNEKHCKNIIQLFDAIEANGLTILIFRELRSVDEQVYVGGGDLHGHFVDLSRDLANGIVFMHNSGIAHLDIKPGNLVYDKDFRLQIIDFDTSVWAKNEEFMIRGYIGSEWWMAPEIGKEDEKDEDRPLYSPIRADRYSCGRVFEAFAKCQRGSDGGLRAFAEKLMNPDPKSRPRLTEWLEPEVMTSDDEGRTASSEDETLVGEVSSNESTKGMVRPHKRSRFEKAEMDGWSVVSHYIASFAAFSLIH